MNGFPSSHKGTAVKLLTDMWMVSFPVKEVEHVSSSELADSSKYLVVPPGSDTLSVEIKRKNWKKQNRIRQKCQIKDRSANAVAEIERKEVIIKKEYCTLKEIIDKR
eukprot:4094203-Ditylum_brightwellii.AAC.1